MSRYFFDLSDGTQERDTVGTVFPNDEAAQREAIRYAGEILRLEPNRLEHGHMRVDVSDQHRELAFSIEMHLIRRR